jgi:hypothetical protein
MRKSIAVQGILYIQIKGITNYNWHYAICDLNNLPLKQGKHYYIKYLAWIPKNN